jgi:hypothetical protein
MQKYLAIYSLLILIACSSDDDPVDCEASGPSISLDKVVNATNCSTPDGSIQVSITGGTEPYQVFINDMPTLSTGQIESLAAGSYSILVSDANSCTTSLDNITILSDDFSFTTSIVSNTSCLAGNGAVTIDVVNTNPPYNFKLGGGSFTSDNVFTGLTTGNHVITVKDNNNCTVTLSVTIPQGTTGTSWASDVKPILEKNCAITGCHNGVSRSNNFSDYTSAKTHAKSIKSKTRDRSMPFDGALTQSQIDLITCWVDDGAQMN